MAELFNIGLSGLRAQQAALAVTGQNITNASTPGYSRQRVEITTQTAGIRGNDFQGGGARLSEIERIADSFATNQIRLDTAMFAELNLLASQISQVETMLLDETSGLDAAMQNFFAALQTASANPSDIPGRQLVVSAADGLTQRFQSLHGRLSEQQANVTGILDAATSRVNEIAGALGNLNLRIAGVDASVDNGGSNALLDQRDELLKELATFVSVATTVQDDGQVNVFIGKGQPIVLGADASLLEVTGGGEIALRPDARSERVLVTASIQGGEMGGALQFRDQVLTPAMNQLGRLAHGLSAAVNDVHKTGVDLRGDSGGLLFTDLNDPAYTLLRAAADESNVTVNPGSVRVTIDDPYNVPLSNYELVFDEANPGAFFVRRQADSDVVFQGVLDGNLPQQVQFDSVTVELGVGDFQPGDRFLIKPLADAAGSIALALSDPAALAFASPLRGDTASGNVGTGRVQIGEIFDSNHPIFASAGALSPPLLVRFLSPTSYEILDNSDPANPVALDPPRTQLPYDPQSNNQLLPGAAGESMVAFAGAQVGGLPTSASVLTALGEVGNGYNAQTVILTQTDANTGTVLGSESLSIVAGSSAREIATLLSNSAGVSASAYTQIEITDLVDNGLGADLSVAVNGVLLGSVGSLNALADAIAANPTLKASGVSAKSDGTTLTLISNAGDDLTIQVAGDLTDSLTVNNAQGQSLLLNGVGPSGDYRTVTVGGSVTAVLTAEFALSSDTSSIMASNPPHTRADFGFLASMTGAAVAGDTFAIAINGSGVGDNRNALALAGLNLQQLIGEPGMSFSDSYAELVQFVGIQSSQSQINRDAASTLLDQSVARRESISGVNLDEEAANLIRYEQAYNASAQIISVARDVFNILFDVVR